MDTTRRFAESLGFGTVFGYGHHILKRSTLEGEASAKNGSVTPGVTPLSVPSVVFLAGVNISTKSLVTVRLQSHTRGSGRLARILAFRHAFRMP